MILAAEKLRVNTVTSQTDKARELGSRLREAREAANLTQDELAERLGMSRRSLQDCELGLAWPRSKRRRRIIAFIEEQAAKAAVG